YSGRDQVLIGVVPSVDNLKILLEDLNNQKKILKDNGIDVDDKLYQVQFVVIVD
ncbi:unnamed protein product, partial [Pocillopora meandrina]